MVDGYCTASNVSVSFKRWCEMQSAKSVCSWQPVQPQSAPDATLGIQHTLPQTMMPQKTFKDENAALKRKMKIFCTQCDYATHLKVRMREHQRKHTAEKPYKCTECGRSFRHKKSLNEHKNKHTGSEPFKCQHCSKKFAYSASLRRHRMTHENKQLECNICWNIFPHQRALQRHQIICKRNHAEPEINDFQ